MLRLSRVIIHARIRSEAAPGRRSCGVFALATVTIALTAIASLACAAEPAKAEPAVVQDFWVINTRCAPGCGELDAGLPQITYSRLDISSGGCSRQASDAKGFQDSARPGVPTTVLIHGYGTTAESAVEHGEKWYGLMKQQAHGHAFRLIVWSWPSERILRRRRSDVKLKDCRSDVEAYYLARVLFDLPKGIPLCLVGHSLGCRTASGSLQLLAGGSVARRSLAPDVLAVWNKVEHRPIRAIMLAPAMNADSLERDCPCGRATLAVDNILVAINSRDFVLKLYSRLYGRHGPEILGRAGPASTLGGKLNVVDVSCELGHKHDFDLHQVSSPVCQYMAWYTFLCDAPATAHSVVSGSNDVKTLRTWTDVSGKYQIEARFVEFKEGTFRLQRANGSYVRIASDLLCSADRKFVSNQP